MSPALQAALDVDCSYICLDIRLCVCLSVCVLVPKGTETPCVISGVSGPIFTKIAQNVAKIVPFITSKAELRYSNPLQNASVHVNEGHFANFRKIGCHGNVPNKIKKRGPDREKITQIRTFHWVKRS